MAYSNIYLHVVWTTKGRFPFLDTPQLRNRVWKHLLNRCIRNNINIISIGGYSDHCHLLFRLSTNQKVGEIIMDLKGESANWINRIGLTRSKFQWQKDYWVESVNPKAINNIKKYIQIQESHHSK